MSARSGKGALQDTTAFQFTIGDRLINPGEVLINDPASSEIKMPTSEFPICPSGNPTSTALALNRDQG